ncbi:MAG: putative RNA polymerase sigma factor [Maribacter sp.]
MIKYHLEAGISFWDTKLENSKEKRENILQLYNQLLLIAYSPIIALNSTYALSKANHKEEAIFEALKIDLKENHSLLAKLYKGSSQSKQIEHLRTAINLAKTDAERKSIEKA